MNQFLKLPVEERKLYFEQASARSGLPAAALEKDFWVCLTLREVFALPDIGEHLTFKGGTSLSKAWGLIQRFSEDVDLVIAKEALGFGGDESPEAAPSKKQRRKRSDAMKAACQAFVHERLKPSLADSLAPLLEHTGSWQLEGDPDDGDRQTILFTYPGVFPAASGGYLRPVVKIEMGSRSDPWPSEQREIQPYLAETFPEAFEKPSGRVEALLPERTFWEKATLLHEENQRPSDKPRNPRLSRHYYDLWAMLRAGVGNRALDDQALFERVVEHRQAFFPYSWADDSTMTRGALTIVPHERLVNLWRADYRAMRDAMFFGESPNFDELLKDISEFQQKFNQSTWP